MKLKRIFTILWILVAVSLGALVGVGVGRGLERILLMVQKTPAAWLSSLCSWSGSAVFLVLGVLTAKNVLAKVEGGINRLKKEPFWQTVSVILGLTAGLVVAYLLTRVVQVAGNAWFAFLVSALLYVILGYTGITLALNHQEGIRGLLTGRRFRHRNAEPGTEEMLPEAEEEMPELPVKVLDSSVIIDGRVLAVARTGFLEGRLLVPEFVLTELRHISDSSDELKRSRGRRGLDILRQLQELPGQCLAVTRQDNEAIPEVDAKLLWLTQQVGGVLMTHDYNLSKVAAVQGVKVLNINDLTSAVKSEALPGEVLSIQLVKGGSQPGQGVGYLADGTMVVVEGGADSLGSLIPAVVTSALQTSAGRMIFAKKMEE